MINRRTDPSTPFTHQYQRYSEQTLYFSLERGCLLGLGLQLLLVRGFERRYLVVEPLNVLVGRVYRFSGGCVAHLCTSETDSIACYGTCVVCASGTIMRKELNLFYIWSNFLIHPKKRH
jgi:hypothetical protein